MGVQIGVKLFGPLSVRTDTRRLGGRDLGGTKPRGLLEILLLARGRVVSKDVLADSLWGASPPQNVASTLEHYVCLLRHRLVDDQQLARQVIVTEHRAYRFDTEHVTVDIDRFDELVVRSELADLATKRAILAEAVEIARGELLEDEPYAAWAQTEREFYRNRVARIHMWLATDAVATAAYDVALRHSEDALRFAPFSEQAFRTIMVANLALGHADLSRDAYARCRGFLSGSLGVDPTTETANIAAAIDAGAPARELVAVLVGPVAEPVKLPRNAHGGRGGVRRPSKRSVAFDRTRRMVRTGRGKYRPGGSWSMGLWAPFLASFASYV